MSNTYTDPDTGLELITIWDGTRGANGTCPSLTGFTYWRGQTRMGAAMAVHEYAKQQAEQAKTLRSLRWCGI